MFDLSKQALTNKLDKKNKGVRTRRVLQNTSNLTGEKPSLLIKEGDINWNMAYKNWVSNKNPTDNVGWNQGVYLWFQPIEEDLYDNLPKIKISIYEKFLLIFASITVLAICLLKSVFLIFGKN